ncbi:MAG: NAD-dependent epimerase/dehydratase family protein [Patescibacteria group bacterium]
MTKIIVTGGAGFIGSHLVNRLIEDGFAVEVVDNLSHGKKENVNSRARLHVADIRDSANLNHVFKGAKYVFHLAALARVQPSIIDPKSTHDVNINGTLNVLLAAKAAKVKRVIYSTSSSAYGNQKKLPIREDAELRPLSPYALQKYIGELYCRLFSDIYGLETVSLRYFNVYGPGAPTNGAYAMMMGKFLDQRKRGQPMTIVPDGRQSRSFTHVSDVVGANMLAMKSVKVGKGEAINIGGVKSYSVLEVAKMIGGPTVFIEPRLEPKRSLPDLKKAKKLLGWTPKITLEQGVAELKKNYGLK